MKLVRKQMFPFYQLFINHQKERKNIYHGMRWEYVLSITNKIHQSLNKHCIFSVQRNFYRP